MKDGEKRRMKERKMERRGEVEEERGKNGKKK
jgi:hypothetical protein